MKVANRVRPEPGQVQSFLAGRAEPVVMVNLLKFREKAVYADGRDTDLSGAQAYRIYAESMRRLLEAAGGRFVFSGEVEGLLLGEVEELWDTVGLAEYPNPKALIEITSSPEYRAIEVHREAGLAGQLNIAVRRAEIA